MAHLHSLLSHDGQSELENGKKRMGIYWRVGEGREGEDGGGEDVTG